LTTCSLHLQPELLNQGRPFRFLSVNIGGIFLGRADEWLASTCGDAFLCFLGIQVQAQFFADPPDDRLRGASRPIRPDGS
jgi:hypothetical protein